MCDSVIASSSYSYTFKVNWFQEPCCSQEQANDFLFLVYALCPQTPEAVGHSSPAEVIVQMLQYGLHIEPGATPASESLKGSPMGFPISAPSSSPSLLYTCISVASVSFCESQPVFQFNLGLLLAGGPTSWASWTFNQPAAHYIPPCP